MQSHPVLLTCLTLVMLSVATLLFLSGLRFGSALYILVGIPNAVAFVNDYLLAVFVSLFTIRFLFQRTPRFNFEPYLHLPISKLTLVHFFQFTSTVTLHNVFPLLFLVPFWYMSILPVSTTLGAMLWLLSIVLLLGMSTFMNNWLRATLSHQRRAVTAFFMLLVMFVVLDQLSTAFWMNDISRWLFDEVVMGNGIVFSLIPLTTLFVFVLSSRSLMLSMRHTGAERVLDRKLISQSPLLRNNGVLTELIVTELRLMWRNRRPRHYLVMSILFSTAYLLFLLANQNAYGGIIFGGVIGLFASGGFALNYGQLMFAWESAYYDGILSRNISVHTIVKSKYLMLQGSCAILFVASLPLFLVLRPDLLAIHLAFLLYNAGVTCTLIMMLALRNRRRVTIGKTGNFFNYEGFSAMHWVWIFPTALPPILALVAFRANPTVGTLIVMGMGLMGLAFWSFWVRGLSTEYHRNRHRMAEGFRIA
ncbi:MAG: hypothetical protein HKN43_09205 [Rhodothermales bacterium]|nr:hypothetical protein [Rhodothermales bacterium]